MGPTSLPHGLDHAISAEDGRRRLREEIAEITPDTVAALRAAADEAVAGGDLEAAADLADWADHAQALDSWRALLATNPADLDEARAIVAASPLTDAFFEVGLGIIKSQLAQAGGPALERAQSRRWTLATAAEITGSPAHRAHSELAEGITRMWPQVWAERSGGGRDPELVAEARTYFRRVADEEAAPLPLRVEALAGLAWLAGERQPDEVATYQARSDELQSQHPHRDLDALRTIRRDRAWWAGERGDQGEVLRLHEANLADTDRDLAQTRSYNAATLVVRGSQEDFAGAIGAALALGDAARVVELAEDAKARAFVHRLSLLALGRPRSAFLAERQDRILAEGSALSRRISASPPAVARRMRGRLDELIVALGQTQQRLVGPPPGVATWLWHRRSVEEIQAALPPDGAYLSYFWSPARVVISVVGPEGLLGEPVAVEVPADELGGDRVARAAFFLSFTIFGRGDFVAMDDIQRVVDEKLEEFWPEQYQRYLYDQLIAPVAERLAGRSTLIISPHGRLRGVPFHALQAPDGRHLIDDHAIAYTDGARLLAACQERRPRRSGGGQSSGPVCFAAGASQGGPAHASEEADAVAAVFGVKASAATRTAVLGEAPGADVVHLACHADLRVALAEAAGLALDDGVVRVSDLRAVDWSAAVVILSACQTAVADIDPLVTGDEMSGIVGAFLGGGASAVAATSWPLADEVAVPLVVRFAQALRSGSSPAEALRLAQLEVKTAHPHPYFWAPFCLWGDATAPIV
jgi:hypothetical protein